MMWSFCIPQVLHALVSLGIPDLLADGPASAEQLAERSATHAPSLYRLLRAAVAVDLVTMKEQLFALTPGGELLRTGVPGSVRNMVLWCGSEDKWLSWGSLDYSVCTGQDAFHHLFGQSAFERLSTHPEKEAIFNETMAEIGRGVAKALGAHSELAGRIRIVDVGGGSGALLAELLTANPGMSGLLFDTDSGLRDAEVTLRSAGVRDRCEIVSGDFFHSVPRGGDTYLLKHIVHNWDDEQAGTILRRCREAMSPDARLYLVESVIPADPSAFGAEVLLHDLNMLVTCPGRERTEAEFTQLCGSAGLRLDRVSALRPPGQPYSLLSAAPV